jgi:hypothetical protein
MARLLADRRRERANYVHCSDDSGVSGRRRHRRRWSSRLTSTNRRRRSSTPDRSSRVSRQGNRDVVPDWPSSLPSRRPRLPGWREWHFDDADGDFSCWRMVEHRRRSRRRWFARAVGSIPRRRTSEHDSKGHSNGNREASARNHDGAGGRGSAHPPSRCARSERAGRARRRSLVARRVRRERVGCGDGRAAAPSAADDATRAGNAIRRERAVYAKRVLRAKFIFAIQRIFGLSVRCVPVVLRDSCIRVSGAFDHRARIKSPAGSRRARDSATWSGA